MQDSKLIYWLLGLLASLILAISGTMASHQLAQSEAINNKLIELIEVRGRTQQQLIEIDRRLVKIEDKLDNVEKLIK